MTLQKYRSERRDCIRRFICILERFDLNLMIEIIVKTSMSGDRPQVKTATDSHSGRLGLNG